MVSIGKKVLSYVLLALLAVAPLACVNVSKPPDNPPKTEASVSNPPAKTEVNVNRPPANPPKTEVNVNN